jgi:hypothetical protein
MLSSPMFVHTEPRSAKLQPRSVPLGAPRASTLTTGQTVCRLLTLRTPRDTYPFSFQSLGDPSPPSSSHGMLCIPFIVSPLRTLSLATGGYTPLLHLHRGSIPFSRQLVEDPGLSRNRDSGLAGEIRPNWFSSSTSHESPSQCALPIHRVATSDGVGEVGFALPYCPYCPCPSFRSRAFWAEQTRGRAEMTETRKTSICDLPECWPPLPLETWKDTCATLHMWTQIVGKVRLALTPLVNHW